MGFEGVFPGTSRGRLGGSVAIRDGFQRFVGPFGLPGGDLAADLACLSVQVGVDRHFLALLGVLEVDRLAPGSAKGLLDPLAAQMGPPEASVEAKLRPGSLSKR